MARLPAYNPEQAPDSVREILSGTLLSLFGMVAHAESAFNPWLKYSNALLTRLELDPLLRELAILQVAHLVDSPYEGVQHVVIARAVGASDAQIEAPARGGRLAGKVAIVTGAGQAPGQEIGNGRATALVFAREGASVALVDRERAAAQETGRDIEAAGGIATVIEADVSVEDDCHA